MAYQRLRRGTEAKQLFDEATQEIEKNVPKKPTLLFSWAQLLDLHLLQREAEELLKQDFGDKSRQPEKKQPSG
jgi:hypothetical protein